MSRNIDEVLKSGFVTPAEDRAIKFAGLLEDNEEDMSEAAAMAVTCEQSDIDHDEWPEVMLDLPDGEWWKAENLPVASKTGGA